MCGIVGQVSNNGVRTEQAILDMALSRLAQRGPDDSGVWRDQRLWFGHRRLAIIDTSSAGHQPMQTSDGRYVIVFNGAIYNHLDLRAQLGEGVQWRGGCDTETLLVAFQRWGIGCLARLNGMFAFAVWDREEQRLVLARDRMGIKPLYYGTCGDQFVFASRPTAAVALLPPEQRGFDHQALRSYLECGFIPAPHSMYKILRKLNAGHYLVFDKQGTRLVRYWDYRHVPVMQRDATEDQLLDELQVLLEEAVGGRLLSDVPLGLYLSSGTDSALVAATLARVSAARPRAFTISFTDPRFDEGQMTAQIAQRLGVDLVTERLGAADLLNALPAYLRAIDEPLADSAGVATKVLSHIASKHITVVLTGDGGDELFAGYPHYTRFAQLLPLLNLPDTARRLACMTLRRLPWHNGKLLAGALSTSGGANLFHYLRSMSKDYPAVLLPEIMRATRNSVEQFEQSAASMALELEPEELASRLDMAFTLPDLYLQKLDMATMAHALEARAPFMDARIVEWAMRLPLQFKLREGATKWILKKLLCRSLPAEWVYRPKQGFSVPIGEWLKGPLQDWAQDMLNDRTLTAQLPIDWPQVHRLLNLQVSGRRNSYPLVWAVLMLLAFIREHEQPGVQPAGMRNVA
ncbi:MAG TPA: asparagine synthase (glutamine-hydrolyzing) [Steroidobacteraceae bacterium]|nr:asparagine synthase (glutamine-hydrolyzing) [Steroidobacteraceae bacterium]